LLVLLLWAFDCRVLLFSHDIQGFCFCEFADEAATANALALNGTPCQVSCCTALCEGLEPNREACLFTDISIHHVKA